jgi:hypothetical protein
MTGLFRHDFYRIAGSLLCPVIDARTLRTVCLAKTNPFSDHSLVCPGMEPPGIGIELFRPFPEWFWNVPEWLWNVPEWLWNVPEWLWNVPEWL